MPRNIGSIDRAFRVAAGMGLLTLVFVGPQTAWGFIGLLSVITGLVGYCPLYHLFHFSTNLARQEQGPSRTA